MKKDKIPFWERVRQNSKKISESPEFQKNEYTKKAISLYFSLFCFIFIVPAYLAEKLLGMATSTVVFIAIFIALVLSNAVTKYKVNKKFGEK